MLGTYKDRHTLTSRLLDRSGPRADLVKRKKKPKDGVTFYFTSTFYLRVQHPRKIISKHYSILARSETSKKLFPRENLINRSKRLRYLGEILSPTVQPGSLNIPGRDVGDKPSKGQGGPVLPTIETRQGRGRGRGTSRGCDTPSRGKASPPKRANSSESLDDTSRGESGTYHYNYQNSSHFDRKHAIAGRNVHLPASRKLNLRWFVYIEDCIHPIMLGQPPPRLNIGQTQSLS